MDLIKLLRKEFKQSFKPLIIISIISGVSNAMLLATINRATTNGENKSDDLRLMFMTIALIGIFILSKKYVLHRSIDLVEELVKKMRCRIMNKIRHSELETIETIGTSEIYAKMTNDAVELSRAGEVISTSFQSIIMVVCTVIYVAFLSIPSFLIMILYFILGYYTYMRIIKSINSINAESSQKEMSFFDSLKSILYGFKEVKINSKKNQGVYDEFVDLTQETKDLHMKSKGRLITAYLFSQSFFYILITVIIFLVPMYVEMEKAEIIKISAAVLFIVGPMESLVASIPAVLGCNVAAQNIIQLEEKLESNLSEEQLEEIANNELNAVPMSFEKEIELKDLCFTYPGKEFNIGPISVRIPKGEITFISGGNGAGKSTFLKLFTGLYYPNAGGIKIDGVPVNEHNYSSHRNLFSVIFTDFFLFERLHSLGDVAQETIDDLLKQLQINDKTSIVDYRITDRNLSTGQRKRVALAVSLLEEKLIYVFDEVAADQDPTFKKYFYNILLQEMKTQGKTVIVVTHDDHYFDVCDNHYKLEDGKMKDLYS